MGGVAAIAREAGFKVTGCDANVYPPMNNQLRALGIDLIEGWDPSQLWNRRFTPREEPVHVLLGEDRGAQQVEVFGHVGVAEHPQRQIGRAHV